MKACLIGAGHWGATICERIGRDSLLTDRLQVSWIIDDNHSSASSLAVKHGADAFGDLHNLRFAATVCDAAIIATPPGTHREVFERVVAAGFTRVRIEKPMALSKDDALAIYKQAVNGFISLQVGHTTAASVEVAVLADLIGDGSRLVAWHSTRHAPKHDRHDVDAWFDLGVHDIANVLQCGLSPHDSRVSFDVRYCDEPGQRVALTRVVFDDESSYLLNERTRMITTQDGLLVFDGNMCVDPLGLDLLQFVSGEYSAATGLQVTMDLERIAYESYAGK